MSEKSYHCPSCGSHVMDYCEVDDPDQWFDAARNLLAIIGLLCVLGFIYGILQRSGLWFT